MATDTPAANLGFEGNLWDAADKLCGNTETGRQPSHRFGQWQWEDVILASEMNDADKTSEGRT